MSVKGLGLKLNVQKSKALQICSQGEHESLSLNKAADKIKILRMYFENGKMTKEKITGTVNLNDCNPQ